MNKKKSKVFLRLYSWTEDECLHTKWLRFHSYNKHQINILHVWLVVSVFFEVLVFIHASLVWEMHSTDLFKMPHWTKVRSMSVKLLRGTSIVSMETCPCVLPNLASALALTVDRVSVGSKCCWNLLPHGARIARSKLPHAAAAAASLLAVGPASAGCCVASWDRLSSDMFLSRLLPGLTCDRLLSMDGSTLYLFKDCGGAAGGCWSMRRTSSWLSWRDCHVMGWAVERKPGSGPLYTVDSGETGGPWVPSVSPA